MHWKYRIPCFNGRNSSTAFYTILENMQIIKWNFEKHSTQERVNLFIMACHQT